jgi:hypothetical protein
VRGKLACAPVHRRHRPDAPLQRKSTIYAVLKKTDGGPTGSASWVARGRLRLRGDGRDVRLVAPRPLALRSRGRERRARGRYTGQVLAFALGDLRHGGVTLRPGPDQGAVGAAAEGLPEPAGLHRRLGRLRLVLLRLAAPPSRSA